MYEAVFWEDHGKGENNQWMDLEKFILLSLLFQVFNLLLSEFYRFLMKNARLSSICGRK